MYVNNVFKKVNADPTQRLYKAKKQKVTNEAWNYIVLLLLHQIILSFLSSLAEDCVEKSSSSRKAILKKKE